MIVIKVLLISATLLFGLMTLRERQLATHQAVRRIALLVLVPVGIVAVAFPDTTVWAAHLVGVKRGTDLLLYIFVMTFLFTTLATYQRLHRVERQLVELTRELALRPEPDHQRESAR
ncbi:DUF2304 domain-containing protein [Nocardioides marmoriginsengisoli]|uniref:DUF2304 domain-containing protein n=1 Tax=Nocardioides marmoriginsengisoli TaxID=661483 RepID=A0A3N0CLB5_9ACTN|nr:DUF2304 domain-containing protein [Nocardioides marmoriginsengisoli]RNL64247.1 DUF2304 domain-containing protein [Nocardioides marmoriginsengisoli]